MNNGKSLLARREVKQILLEFVGEEGLDIVKNLVERKATDEEVAEKTGLKLNNVRKILYKLYDYRLASYVRTKDKDIGWYIYTWKLDLHRVSDIINARKRRSLEELSKRLEFEKSNVFFYCKNDGSKVPFDAASENDFKCPQCNGIMIYTDNHKNVARLEEEITRLRRAVRH